MDNMDFNKYWNNRIYTDEEKLELAQELSDNNNFNYNIKEDEYIRGYRAKFFTYDYNLDIAMEEFEEILKSLMIKN